MKKQHLLIMEKLYQDLTYPFFKYVYGNRLLGSTTRTGKLTDKWEDWGFSLLQENRRRVCKECSRSPEGTVREASETKQKYEIWSFWKRLGFRIWPSGMTPCCVVGTYQYVGGNGSLRLPDHSEYGGSRVLDQVHNHLQYYTAPWPPEKYLPISFDGKKNHCKIIVSIIHKKFFSFKIHIHKRKR